ncbi:major facilitator superfamily domain-containing protein [Penicillium samsonianum]|uniref:major facilitator superfamily domain-containing protein n=1 Tax=Penicillium samsonianum TaxID=1882272 RepID=UPI0025487801|nr:major facilitator superfamily domain-containing protein [Penicillium samsonianum]KAJ6133472.1 major facilitator superfamily domain-containing protein [Penicillium samsonianum]
MPQSMLGQAVTSVSEAPPTTEFQEAKKQAQHGVQVAEAVTMSWSKRSLILVYICMWLIYFVRALNGSLTANLSPYITSDFHGHSLLTVIEIITNVMSAACTMPIAKILNIWDRVVALTSMLFIAMIGLILMACCHNISTYCVAQAFVTVGFTGLIFCVDVLTADTSKVQDRALAFAFTSSPYIIMAFAGAPLSESFNKTNWRWAYGTIAILLPIVTMPLVVIWLLARKKAQQVKDLGRPFNQKTWTQSIKHLIVEFDMLGILLLTAGLSLFLLAFVLAGSQEGTWHSTRIICMIVIGGVAIGAFVIYERFFATMPFIPYHLLVSRTIVGTCLLNFTYIIAASCWGTYFTSFLQVVYNVTLMQAGYITAIANLISPLWLIGVGWLVHITGRFKWLLLCAIPIYMLAIGLMIYFRTPGHSIGYMCMCEVFLGFGTGTIIALEQTAVLAASEHDNYASTLALLGLSGSIGGAIGNSISGAIWTNTLPNKLQELLPDETKPRWNEIYESLPVQLSFETGSTTRIAIERAYAIAQRNMLVAGISIMAVTVVWVLLIKDIRLKERNDTKGLLF